MGVLVSLQALLLQAVAGRAQGAPHRKTPRKFFAHSKAFQRSTEERKRPDARERLQIEPAGAQISKRGSRKHGEPRHVRQGDNVFFQRPVPTEGTRSPLPEGNHFGDLPGASAASPVMRGTPAAMAMSPPATDKAWAVAFTVNVAFTLVAVSTTKSACVCWVSASETEREILCRRLPSKKK